MPFSLRWSYAYQQGRRAAQAGRSLDDCPYPTHRMHAGWARYAMADAWQAGWRSVAPAPGFGGAEPDSAPPHPHPHKAGAGQPGAGNPGAGPPKTGAGGKA